MTAKSQPPFEIMPSEFWAASLQQLVQDSTVIVYWKPDPKFERSTEKLPTESSFKLTEVEVVGEKAVVKTSSPGLEGEWNCRASTATDIFFFRVELTAGKGRLSSPLYRIQRRAQVRIPITPSEAPSVELTVDDGNTRTVYFGSLVDLSTGGCAVLADKKTTVPLAIKVGGKVAESSADNQIGFLRILSPAGFIFDRLPIKMVHAKSLKNKKMKLGLQFHNLTSDIENKIHGWVVRQSSRFFGRV